MTTTFDPIRFQRELHNALDRRRIALQGEDDINRRIHETAITVAVEMISNALDKAFVVTPPPGCGVVGQSGSVDKYEGLGGAAEISPLSKIDADDRMRLRSVVNSEVKDDGARILLHRLINASGPQRTLLDAMEDAGWKRKGKIMSHAWQATVASGAMCVHCGFPAGDHASSNRFTIEEDRRDAVRATALAAARETLSADNQIVVRRFDWHQQAVGLARTILAIFGEEM